MTQLEHCRQLAVAATAARLDGPGLDARAAALVALGVAASVTSLDGPAIDAAIENALDAGASVDQLQEVIALISGLGVHSLMVTATRVLAQAEHRGLMTARAPLDAARQALWDSCVGDDPFWVGFEQEVPGFLDAMLRLSPDVFQGFFNYCAIPWRSGTVCPLTKELIAMASDATPTHRFLPGFRIHLHNAIKLGASRQAVLQTLDIAACAPGHSGVC